MRKQAMAAAAESGPLGLYDRWPWIHLLIAGLVLAAAAATWPWVLEHPRWLWFLVLPLPVLALHEWEEFVFPGGFPQWFNSHVCRSADPRLPFTGKQAALSHMPLMALYPLLAVVGARWPWVGLAGLYGLIADGLFHISATATGRRYSPGTVTALLLYLPLGISATYYFVDAGEVTLPALLAAVFLGVLALNLFLYLPSRRAAVRRSGPDETAPAHLAARPSRGAEER